MMNLHPELLDRIFNTLDALIEDYGVHLYLVFVWLALAIIAWIFSGGLRRRMKGNPPTIIDIEIEQTRNDDDEIMD
jgi:hypothetical protein